MLIPKELFHIIYYLFLCYLNSSKKVWKFKKKKMLWLPSPDLKILKIGSVGRDFLYYNWYFFFFFFTYRERVDFPIFFLKFLNGENSGGMQSKRIYKSCKCFFKPLRVQNFSKFFAKIWHKKKKKKTRPCFFAIVTESVGRGQHKHFFFLA